MWPFLLPFLSHYFCQHCLPTGQTILFSTVSAGSAGRWSWTRGFNTGTGMLLFFTLSCSLGFAVNLLAFFSLISLSFAVCAVGARTKSDSIWPCPCSTRQNQRRRLAHFFFIFKNWARGTGGGSNSAGQGSARGGAELGGGWHAQPKKQSSLAFFFT